MTRPAVLSPSFSWEQVEASATAKKRRILNTLPDELLVNAARTAQFIECVLGLVGASTISSWYRCPILNEAVGSKPSSKHLLALAADLTPLNVSLDVAFERIRASALPFDQLIVERTTSGSAWLHVGLSLETPRREALKALGATLGGTMAFTRVSSG